MRPRLHLAFEFLLYAILTALMLHATWLTWPDAFVDFSREVYLPWRVSCGDVLYHDLAYYFGPVSVYVNAALFALLGRPSIHSLFALNFIFWIATLLALRALLRRIASPLAATLAVSSFILLFSFSRYTLVGNYNFLAPYSHEITRGFLFSLLALLSLDSGFRRLPDTSRRLPVRFLLPGFLFALVLFSKPELAFAAAASLVLLVAAHARQRRALRPGPCLVFFFAVLATVALVVAPFAIVFRSLPRALHDTLLKLYLDCFNPALTSLPFFANVFGTDRLLPNMFRLAAGALLAVLPFLLARLALPRLPSSRLRLLATSLLSVFAAAIGWFAWSPLNAALPVAPLAFLGFSLWNRIPSKSRNPVAESSPSPLTLSFALFAVFLVSKMLFNASVTFYGFVLALPAFCCALSLAFRPPCPPARTAIAACLLLAFLAGGLRLHASTLRNFAIRAPVFDDSFRTAEFQAQTFNSALAWIRGNTPPASTLAVLPEGAILNVFGDRPNPTPFASLPVTDLPRYDSAALLAAYSNSPPDTLVLVAKLGDPQFGVDYAQDLMALLAPLYAPAMAIPLATPSGPIPYLVIARRQ